MASLRADNATGEAINSALVNLENSLRSDQVCRAVWTRCIVTAASQADKIVTLEFFHLSSHDVSWRDEIKSTIRSGLRMACLAGIIVTALILCQMSTDLSEMVKGLPVIVLCCAMAFIATWWVRAGHWFLLNLRTSFTLNRLQFRVSGTISPISQAIRPCPCLSGTMFPCGCGRSTSH